MGACRAVSRMRRRSRARRPAHGVCIVSFLRLAQRSWHAARRAARAYMGACRAVSRMRRRSRARRPAHGVCIVSFLRLAQRSWHAARSTRDAPARAHARRRLAACPWLASGVAHMRLARVSGGRLAVGFGRDGKQARARGAHARASGHLPSSGSSREACAPRGRLRPVRVRKAPPPLSPSARMARISRPRPSRMRAREGARSVCPRVALPLCAGFVSCHPTARANAPPRAPPFRRSLWLDLRP